MTPLLSLVVPVYGVERYLSAFLESISSQDPKALSRLEVIIVNDGSPDRSGDIAREWFSHTMIEGRVIDQENAGAAAARNAGMSLASGTWISFPDPDDVLDAGYIAALVDCLHDRDDTFHGIVATNLIYLDDATGEYRDKHPLKGSFSHGRRIYDLANCPQSFRLSAASACMRLDRIRGAALTFDTRVKPNFEDGAFIARYNLLSADPKVLVVPDARYLYRRRADQSSLVASSWKNSDKYLNVPKYGWIATLQDAHRAIGHVPKWLQHAVLYDLVWYFVYDGRIHTPTKGLSRSVKTKFLHYVHEALQFIDDSTIAEYELTNVGTQIRTALLAIRDGHLPTRAVNVWRADRVRGLIQLKYYYCGDRPVESICCGSAVVQPLFSKDRSVVYFDKEVLTERILWVAPTGELRITLDGIETELHVGPPILPRYSLSEIDLTKRLKLQPDVIANVPGNSRPPRRKHGLESEKERRQTAKRKLWRARLHRAVHGRSRVFRKIDARITRFLANHSAYGRKFADAWSLMDRDRQAQDNAEHLYRWILRNHPEQNAWFIIHRNSPDWVRLKNEGFRLVAHGTRQHRALLLRTSRLISSHVDSYVVNPLDTRYYGSPTWQFVFLQHGVTKDDISRWLNGKPIRRIISTSRAEHTGFVGRHTPYTFTEREVRLTGFPRHDALLEKSQSRGSERKDSIVIMPTWREYLFGPPSGKGTHRELRTDFDDSVYAKAWNGYLRSSDLERLAREHDLEVLFVPHPNLESHIDSSQLPSGSRVIRYSDGDIQDVIARARVLVTDYSSLAFEAAYISTPVVYFQFDREEFFSDHPHRPGYFDYDRDGFGPVAETIDDALAATQSAVEGLLAEAFSQRALDFFEYRDGQCCSRVYESILDLSASRNSERPVGVLYGGSPSSQEEDPGLEATM